VTALIKYHKALFEAYITNLRLAIKNPEPDVIHELRVAIKKLRVLYNFAEFINAKFNSKKHFVRFKPIFSTAGNLRDLDITLSLLEAETIGNQSLHSLLQGRRQRLIVEIKRCSAHSLKSSNKPDNELLRTISGVIPRKKISKFIRCLRNDLHSIRSKHLSKKRLHRLRKSCKEYGYIIEASKEREYQKDIKKVKKLQKVLGQWHDYSRTRNILGDIHADSKIRNVFRRKEKKYRQKAIHVIKKANIF
jgi:CHAD domain-containing protein